MNLHNKPEIWELYDYNGVKVGRIRRGERIPGGLYHTSVEVIPSDRKGHVLITKRSPEKRKGGGLYEFPAGSVKAGETVVRAALRELNEETGLKATQLIHIQTEKTPFSPSQSGLIRHTFLALVEDLPNKDVVLQPSETVDYQIVTVEQLKADYITKKLFDETRLHMYRNDFFERLEALVGPVPEEEKEKPEDASVHKPVFRLVKKTKLSELILKKEPEIDRQEESP